MKRLLRLLLAAAITAFVAAAQAQAPQPPEIAARSWLLLDVTTDQVLGAKDADTPVEPASLTKLMTAMVVLDANQDMREEIRIDDADVDRLKHSKSRVRVGATMSREAALELALISSENRGRPPRGGVD